MMMYAVLVSVFGLIVGSFLNVVILRFRTGRSLGGRSLCMSCQHELRWFDLIPVLSFVWLRGRCRDCDARIRVQYPLVELLTGLVFVGSWLTVGLSWSLPILFLIGMILVVLTVYDIRHQILPDPFVLALGIVALFMLLIPALHLPNVYGWLTDSFIFDHVLAVIIVPGLFFLLWLVSEGRWFGLGDVKLMAVIGLMMGVWQGLEIVVMSFWLAMLWVILMVFRLGILNLVEHLRGGRRVFHLNRRVPFGPFLALALFLSLIGIHVFQFLLV